MGPGHGEQRVEHSLGSFVDETRIDDEVLRIREIDVAAAFAVYRPTSLYSFAAGEV